MEIVFERHWPVWRDGMAKRERIAAAARLSVEINVLLAGLLHGAARRPTRLAAAACAAGVAGMTHFLNASRIFERVSARVRAGLVR